MWLKNGNQHSGSNNFVKTRIENFNRRALGGGAGKEMKLVCQINVLYENHTQRNTVY